MRNLAAQREGTSSPGRRLHSPWTTWKACTLNALAAPVVYWCPLPVEKSWEIPTFVISPYQLPHPCLCSLNRASSCRHTLCTRPSKFRLHDGSSVKENQGEQGVFQCNYLHVQNDPSSASQCRSIDQTNRICRNMGCRETSTHIVGSGMCVGLDPDSIANIAFDSMKFKGATKKFNQV